MNGTQYRRINTKMVKNKLSDYEKREKLREYGRKRYLKSKDHCKCGNMKAYGSRTCRECYRKNKYGGLNYLAKN